MLHKISKSILYGAIFLFFIFGLINSSFARLYLVSANSDGEVANGPSQKYYSQISGNGRFVVFQSDASNLVPNDTNGANDIFIHDLKLLTTIRVSVGLDNVESNGHSLQPSISDDGRFVVFTSSASNLVDDDNNGVIDVFVRDLVLNTTEKVSISSSEIEGNGASGYAKISPDGSYVIFASAAINFENYNYVEYGPQYYVRDRVEGTTKMASKWSNNTPMSFPFQWEDLYIDIPKMDISSGGDYVTFVAFGESIYWRDLANEETRLITHKIGMPNVPASGYALEPNLSNDGQTLAFTYWYTDDEDPLINTDTIPFRNIAYVYDVASNTKSVPIGPDHYYGMEIPLGEGSFWPKLSGDGKHMGFSLGGSADIISTPQDIYEGIDTFIKDLEENVIGVDLVSTSNQNVPIYGQSYIGDISFDGQAISFQNYGYNEEIDYDYYLTYAKVPCIDSIKAPITWIKEGPGIVNLPPNQTKSSQITIDNATHGCVANVGVHPKFGNIGEANWKALKIDLVSDDGSVVSIKKAGAGTYVNGSFTKFGLDLRIEDTWTLEVTNTNPRAMNLSMDEWSVIFNFPIFQAIPFP